MMIDSREQRPGWLGGWRRGPLRKVPCLRCPARGALREVPWVQSPVTTVTGRASDHKCSCAPIISVAIQPVCLQGNSPAPTEKVYCLSQGSDQCTSSDSWLSGHAADSINRELMLVTNSTRSFDPR